MDCVVEVWDIDMRKIIGGRVRFRLINGNGQESRWDSQGFLGPCLNWKFCVILWYSKRHLYEYIYVRINHMMVYPTLSS